MSARILALILALAHVVAATTPCLFPLVPGVAYAEETGQVIPPPDPGASSIPQMTQVCPCGCKLRAPAGFGMIDDVILVEHEENPVSWRPVRPEPVNADLTGTLSGPPDTVPRLSSSLA